MKKLLGIVVLGLMLSGNAYAELITLSKCYLEKYVWVEKNSHTSKIINGIVKSFPKPSSRSEIYEFNSFEENYSHPEFNHRENLLFTLDTVTEIITLTIVNSESYIENSLNKGVVQDKYKKFQYRITDLGGNIATAEYLKKTDQTLVNKIDVDFVSNKVFATKKMSFKFANGVSSSDTTSKIYKCERQ